LESAVLASTEHEVALEVADDELTDTPTACESAVLVTTEPLRALLSATDARVAADSAFESASAIGELLTFDSTTEILAEIATALLSAVLEAIDREAQ
jgi:hypothetical protein